MVPVPDQARSTMQKEQEVTVPNLPLLRAHKMANLGALWVPSKRSQGTFVLVWSSQRTHPLLPWHHHWREHIPDHLSYLEPLQQPG